MELSPKPINDRTHLLRPERRSRAVSEKRLGNGCLKIAQPFMAGFPVRKSHKSRKGRKNYCRPLRDFEKWHGNHPALKGWAIVGSTGVFSTHSKLWHPHVFKKRHLDRLWPPKRRF